MKPLMTGRTFERSLPVDRTPVQRLSESEDGESTWSRVSSKPSSRTDRMAGLARAPAYGKAMETAKPQTRGFIMFIMNPLMTASGSH